MFIILMIIVYMKPVKVIHACYVCVDTCTLYTCKIYILKTIFGSWSTSTVKTTKTYLPIWEIYRLHLSHSFAPGKLWEAVKIFQDWPLLLSPPEAPLPRADGGSRTARDNPRSPQHRTLTRPYGSGPADWIADRNPQEIRKIAWNATKTDAAALLRVRSPGTLRRCLPRLRLHPCNTVSPNCVTPN